MTAVRSMVDRERRTARAERAVLALATLGITATHMVVSVGTHRLHVVHVLFGGLYLLPIVAGALWFRLRGALAASVAISIAYATHVAISWRGQPMENANQIAMIAVYLFVGLVSGVLAEREARERARRLETERRAQRTAVVQGIASLANALGSRDEYTRQHCERVAALAVRLGQRLGLGEERLERLRLAGLVHDLGKIGVRDDVLFKPDELTAEERARIERHPTLAAEILRPIQNAGEIADIVLAHHECPDGSGYPLGLRDQAIPLEARIVRVADVFSALTDSRPYKPALATDDALRQMRALGGGKLDLVCVAALGELLGG